MTDSLELRRVLGAFSTGITVPTTGEPGAARDNRQRLHLGLAGATADPGLRGAQRQGDSADSTY